MRYIADHAGLDVLPRPVLLGEFPGPCTLLLMAAGAYRVDLSERYSCLFNSNNVSSLFLAQTKQANRALCFTRYSGKICAVRWTILPPDNFYDR